VETPFGIHIIKVEDKRLPDFDTMRDDFREQHLQRLWADAEESYLTQLTEARRLEVQDGAVDVARELARKPSTNLSRRAAQRPLARYTNGALTAGEFVTLMQQRPAQQRAQIAAFSDEQLTDWIRLIARDEILIDEARGLGLETPQSTRDSASAELRDQIRQAAREAGLMPIVPGPGESQNQAVQRVVTDYLQGIIAGEKNVVPLGAIGFSLREQYGADVLERAIPTVVARVEERRPPGSDMQMPPMPQQPPPQQPMPPGGGN
jgi:hypothetical protein